MVQEVTGVEQGRGTGSKVDDTEFEQQTQLQYDVLDLFDYGDAPPLSPSFRLAVESSFLPGMGCTQRHRLPDAAASLAVMRGSRHIAQTGP